MSSLKTLIIQLKARVSSRILAYLKGAKSDRSQLALLESAKRRAYENPQDSALQIKYATALAGYGRLSEASYILEGQAKEVRDSAEWIAASAKLASESRDYGEAVKIHQTLLRLKPSDEAVHLAHIHYLMQNRQFDEALALHESGLDRFNSVRYKAAKAKLLFAQKDREQGCEILRELLNEHPNNIDLMCEQVRFLITQRKTNGIDPTELYELSVRILSAQPNNPLVKFLHVNALIACGKINEALQAVEAFSKHSRIKGIMQCRAWAAHQLGDIEQARQIWDEIRAKHYIPQITYDLSSPLERKDQRELPEVSNEIRVYSAIKNERWRLPWFFDYYRKLGVDRFIFVDNGSTDGSMEWLLDQPDCHVFQSLETYDKAFSGMKWINHLVSIYGKDGWSMYVDVDEAFVFPYCEEIGLRGLTLYLDSQNHDLVRSFMVDMFAKENVPLNDDGFERDFISNYPYFDDFYIKTPVSNCPYYFVSGGVRRHFQFMENLAKTPMVRGGRNIQYLMSSHITTPGRISDVTGAMLHFKLAGDYRASFERELKDNNRAHFCMHRHQIYLSYLEERGNEVDFSGPHTRRYKSSQTLVDLKLLECPKQFDSIAL